MPSTISLYFREQILQRVFRQQAIGSVAYVALTRAVAAANSDGGLLDEPPSNFGYARVRYDLTATNWELIGSAELVSTLEVPFAAPTGHWGLIQGWALTTASAGGELIASGSLINPRRVSFGSVVSVKSGAMAFSLGDASA